MGSKNDFQNLFDEFAADDFFADAVYAFSWTEEIVGTINRTTGVASKSTNTYSCNAFRLNPSRTERESKRVFRDTQIGDIVIMVNQRDLAAAPPLNHLVTFDGEIYSFKGIVQDPVKATWKFLLRK